MSEKYIDLADKISDDLEPTMVGDAYIRNSLRWLDEHPDQVPGRTIMESDLKVMAASILAYEGPNMEGRIQRHLIHFGITVVPDPEPTNADQLIDLLCNAPANLNRRNLGIWLDKAGLKAPGGDDDQ